MHTFTHEDAITAGMRIEGWMQRGELAILARLAASLPTPAWWVEIGSWAGRSALAVALSLPTGSRLDLIDPCGLAFPDYPDAVTYASYFGGWPYERLQETLAFIRKNRPDVRVTHYRLTSRLAAPEFPEGKLDAVFVDGDHTFSAVTEDCRTWLPKLRPCGLMVGHDYAHPKYPGVQAAVRKLFGDDHETIPGTDFWCVERPLVSPREPAGK